jgi:hypothetical protein
MACAIQSLGREKHREQRARFGREESQRVAGRTFLGGAVHFSLLLREPHRWL